MLCGSCAAGRLDQDAVALSACASLCVVRVGVCDGVCVGVCVRVTLCHGRGHGRRVALLVAVHTVRCSSMQCVAVRCSVCNTALRPWSLVQTLAKLKRIVTLGLLFPM